MAEATLISSEQVTITETVQPPVRSPQLLLKLHKPKADKKVKWDQGTIDNEHMNKKKSKCCCIYEKPRLFGESSDEDDDDDDDCTGSCHGHKGKCYRAKPPENDSGQPQEQSHCH